MRLLFVIFCLISTGLKLGKIYLNRKQHQMDLPDYLKTLYDEKEYKRWIEYEDETDRFSLFTHLLSLAISLCFILSPIYQWLYDMFPKNVLLNSLCMMMFVVLFEEIIGMIEDSYRTFVIEEKYHMNTTTLKTFIIDKVKDIVLDIGIFAVLFVCVHYFYLWFSYVGFIVLFVVLIVIVRLIQKHSLAILKIYNQFTPLEDGVLKDKLIALVEQQGFELKGLYVMDASKRTKRANAFCTGEGKQKTISIDDNMFTQYSEEEILAVFCHELGHAALNHSDKLKWQAYLQMIVMFVLFVFILVNPQLYECFGIYEMNYYMVTLILSIFMGPLMFVIQIPMNIYSRNCEYEADAFAVKQDYGQALHSVLYKLTKDDLADINPHPLVVKTTYSHPPIALRLQAIDEEMNKIC